MGQDLHSSDTSIRYRKIGFIAGVLLYDKAKLSDTYGNYRLQNYRMWDASFGLVYEPIHHGKLTYSIALMYQFKPVTNFNMGIPIEEISDTETNYLIGERNWNIYMNYLNLSMPIFVKRSFDISEKLQWYATAGARLEFINTDGVITVGGSVSDRRYLDVVIFPNAPFIHTGMVLGGGITSKFKKVKLDIMLYYGANFANSFEGDYRLFNMRLSDESGGKYSVSGNHFGLMVSTLLPKPEKIKKPISDL